MLYIPTQSEDVYWAIVPRSHTFDDIESSRLTMYLTGPQGNYHVGGRAEQYGPFYVLTLYRYGTTTPIPAGEYTFSIHDRDYDTGPIERGICRVFADPVETTQYETNYNVKEYE